MIAQSAGILMMMYIPVRKALESSLVTSYIAFLERVTTRTPIFGLGKKARKGLEMHGQMT